MDINGRMPVIYHNQNIYGANKTEFLNTNNVSDDFKKLLDTITGGEIAQEIRDKYNVFLNIESVGSVESLLDSCDMRCKNYVSISAGTLSKMEENPVLKNKVMSAIEEFCSPIEQAKVNALQPPVKSAGMIIYPDGEALYWLESYPNDFEDVKSEKKTIIDSSLAVVEEFYGVSKESSKEYNVEIAMQYLSEVHKRKNVK